MCTVFVSQWHILVHYLLKCFAPQCEWKAKCVVYLVLYLMVYLVLYLVVLSGQFYCYPESLCHSQGPPPTAPPALLHLLYCKVFCSNVKCYKIQILQHQNVTISNFWFADTTPPTIFCMYHYHAQHLWWDALNWSVWKNTVDLSDCQMLLVNFFEPRATVQNIHKQRAEYTAVKMAQHVL